MRVTKRVFQRRLNNFIALLIVIDILLALWFTVFYYNSYILAFVMGGFTPLVLYQFPWYKFK